MGRLDARIGKLETVLIKPAPKEWRLLSRLDPEFKRQCAEAEAAGAQVIALVPLEPLAQPAPA